MDSGSDRTHAPADAAGRGGVRGERNVPRRARLVERVDRHGRRGARARVSVDRPRTHVERGRHAAACGQRGARASSRSRSATRCTAWPSAANTRSRSRTFDNVAITTTAERRWRRRPRAAAAWLHVGRRVRARDGGPVARRRGTRRAPRAPTTRGESWTMVDTVAYNSVAFAPTRRRVGGRARADGSRNGRQRSGRRKP